MASHNYRFKKDMEIADQVELIAAHIKQNYKKDITQAQVSRRFNMTQETFCRFFKKHFDRGFSKYVNSLRVGEACNLLMETDASVAEIAYNVGFNNISNFNRHFF
jgi:transcriptional regulator GlxA family with amidase domain